MGLDRVDRSAARCARLLVCVFGIRSSTDEPPADPTASCLRKARRSDSDWRSGSTCWCVMKVILLVYSKQIAQWL